MNKSIYLVLLSALFFFLFSAQADAFQCVNPDGAALQAALNTAISGDNEVRLRTGTYAIPGDPAVHFNITTARSLTISGGWNAGCSLQTADPKLTILQGGARQDEETYFYGGGVLLVLIYENTAPAAVAVSNLTIEKGLAESDGGGLSIQHDYTTDATLATVSISHVIVQNNTTEIWFGSGIAVEDWGTSGGMSVSITDAIVQENTVPDGSTAGPAGIFINNWGAAAHDTTISRCRILNNKAGADGGGLFIDSGEGDATLVNNIIAGNSVAEGPGGGIFIDNGAGGDTFLTNNTITANSAEGSGGGIYAFMEAAATASVLNIYNSIIYGNTAGANGADLYVKNEASQMVNLFNNDLNTTMPTGVFIANADPTSFISSDNLNNINPQFVGSNDYHLGATSPVINNGNNDAPGLPPEDLDGNSRLVSCQVDMGAYEYQETLRGDIDTDGEVDIQDAIEALQILSGTPPLVPVCRQSDANDDGRIGPEDVIFILQTIGLLRP